jgi:hypothetical protein
MNQVALVGNITGNPALRYTQSGGALAGFTIAVSHRSKHLDDIRRGNGAPSEQVRRPPRVPAPITGSAERSSGRARVEVWCVSVSVVAKWSNQTEETVLAS